MGRSLGLIGMLIVAAIGGYLYLGQMRTLTPNNSPEAAIDTVAVRNDLMAIANAERRYWATNAKYASLDDLQKGGDIHIPSRPHYAYSANAGETNFKITATYSGPDPKAAKHVSIDESLVLKND